MTSSPKRVLITDYMGDDTSLEESIFGEAGIEVTVAASKDPRSWLKAALEVDGILTRHAPITASTIGQLAKCRIISRYGTGTDNIDVPSAEEHGIQVAYVAGYSTSEVADHSWAMALGLSRSVPLFDGLIANGGWQPERLPTIRRLEGQTIGLIGFGRIGAAVGQRARASGMNVLAFDPYATLPPEVEAAASVEEVMGRSAIISLHAPLTADTRHIINDRSLQLAKGAILINASRGALIDLEAALRALDSGNLVGLGLDVFEVEPLPSSSEVRGRPDVLLTPHVGYYSVDSLQEAKTRSSLEIVRVLAGN